MKCSCNPWGNSLSSLVFLIRLGDRLQILNRSNDDWWYAHSPKMAKEGYIPSSFVAHIDSLEANE